MLCIKNRCGKESMKVSMLIMFFQEETFILEMVFQIGKTKVFLRAGQMAELDARRTEVLSSAAKAVQRRIRTHNARKRFLALREATISLQAICRGEHIEIT